jgi:aspartyl-tRNA(Asn)/glutamyl-tRNA(Gln) amidotransferase subunit A
VTLLEAAQSLRTKHVSSLELTQECFRRIRALDGKLNTFLTLIEESALASARRCDEERAAGRKAGLLHGIPVALKDLFFTKGVRTTAGSKIYGDFVPDHDGAVAEKLQAAGAVNVGKLGMHELAFGITSNNAHYGAVRNPWDPARIPGGSSGGSGAAVAAGLVFAAMGSDTGGSIRIPASYCGTAGIKPTYGRVSRYGSFPLGFSLDHMGPLARTSRDCAAVLDAISGHDERDSSTVKRQDASFLPPEKISLKGLRIVVAAGSFIEQSDAEVVKATRSMADAAAKLGASVSEQELNWLPDLVTISHVILLAEAAAANEAQLHRRAEIGLEVLPLLEQGRLLPATDYVNAQRLRAILCREAEQLWRNVDAVLLPSTGITAPRIGESSVTINGRTEEVRMATTRYVRPFNVLGWPAHSIVSGFHSNGMPMSLQVVTPSWREDRALLIGAALEDATGYWKQQPVVSA